MFFCWTSSWYPWRSVLIVTAVTLVAPLASHFTRDERPCAMRAKPGVVSPRMPGKLPPEFQIWLWVSLEKGHLNFKKKKLIWQKVFEAFYKKLVPFTLQELHKQQRLELKRGWVWRQKEDQQVDRHFLILCLLLPFCVFYLTQVAILVQWRR